MNHNNLCSRYVTIGYDYVSSWGSNFRPLFLPLLIAWELFCNPAAVPNFRPPASPLGSMTWTRRRQSYIFSSRPLKSPKIIFFMRMTPFIIFSVWRSKLQPSKLPSLGVAFECAARFGDCGTRATNWAQILTWLPWGAQNSCLLHFIAHMP